MKLTKKEIKLIIKTFEQHKDNLESEWSVELMVEEKDFLNKLYEAINNTHCCTELKSKPILSFEDWYITYGYSKTVAGNFIKEGSRITRDELMHRYKTEHLKTF